MKQWAEQNKCGITMSSLAQYYRRAGIRTYSFFQWLCESWAVTCRNFYYQYSQKFQICRNLIFNLYSVWKKVLVTVVDFITAAWHFVAAPLDLFLCTEFPNLDEQFRQRLSSSRQSCSSRLVIDKRDNIMKYFHSCYRHVCIYVGWLKHRDLSQWFLFHEHRGVSWMLLQFLLRLSCSPCVAYTSCWISDSITQVQYLPHTCWRLAMLIFALCRAGCSAPDDILVSALVLPCIVWRFVPSRHCRLDLFCWSWLLEISSIW